MRILYGFLAAVGLALIIVLIVMWTGAYDFASSAKHPGVVRSAIDRTFRNWVESGASELSAPNFSQQQLREGAREFMEYCVHCHGAPGEKAAEWSTGMSPNPPEIAHIAEEWTPEQIFFIVKNGIRMSGMPPFGDTESDQTIWNIAGFVKQIPALGPEGYRRLREELGGHSHGSQGAGGH